MANCVLFGKRTGEQHENQRRREKTHTERAVKWYKPNDVIVKYIPNELLLRCFFFLRLFGFCSD